MKKLIVFEQEQQDGKPLESNNPRDFLTSTWYMDWENPVVQQYTAEKAAGADDDVSKAIKLFYAVRDDFLYSPYDISIDREDYRTSALIQRGHGWCVQKSLAMAACCRALGIPARLGYADVKNHLTTPKLRESMGTDYFSYHGYAEIWLNGRWVKATPVFNLTLCQKAKVKPQEFDGHEDALFQEYDQAGHQHMEYLQDRGTYSDLPFHEIMTDFAWRYPKYQEQMWGIVDAEDFANDAAQNRQPVTAGQAA